MDIVGLLIQIVVSLIVLAPVLWLVGRSLAGKQNAKLTDALWIVLLGVVIGTVVGELIGNIIGTLITLVVWLGLIKHFFDCGWLKAFAIAIVTVIVFAVIIFVLTLIGIGIGFSLSSLGF